MTVLVVDASVAVKWVVPELGSGEAEALRRHDLVAPRLIYAECANVLWAKSRRRELASGEAIERLRLLLDAPIRTVPTPELLPRALELALELEHPAYDCAYLALALDRKVALVSADDRFVQKISSHGRYREAVRSLVGDVGF